MPRKSSSSSTRSGKTTRRSRATGRITRCFASATSSEPEEELLIAVELFLDRQGCLRRLRAEGHAGEAARGDNIVCAAATVLMRTTARLLDGIGEIPTSGSAEREGHLDLWVGAVPEERRRWLRGVSDSLFQGLADLERDHPDLIALRIHDCEE